MTLGIFEHFFGLETTLVEREFMRGLASLISYRSARLAACAAGAIVSRKGYGMDESGVSVGVDGSLYRVSVFVLWRGEDSADRIGVLTGDFFFWV
jgi:hexokinase